VELRHIRYFLAVAEYLNFSKAAQQLHIAQPPLSRQIRQLEDDLGVALFMRNKRRVVLTKAGRLFVDEARKLVVQAGTLPKPHVTRRRGSRVSFGLELRQGWEGL
jgi:DNA-binding transcriptional LysR family regulator